VAQQHANDQGEEIVDKACCLYGNTVFLHKDIAEAKTFDQVLEEASKSIFVPLTVGGSIRSYTDPTWGQTWSALQVATRYF